MPSLNKVILTGNVVRDFEKKSDKLGVVSIAQNIWNGKEEEAHFYNITLLGEKNVQAAEKIVKKGANITIEGSLENNSYEKDGKKITTLQIKSFSFYVNKYAQNSESQEVVPEDIDDQPIDFNNLAF
jgi:single-stranded DNA-binding protein